MLEPHLADRRISAPTCWRCSTRDGLVPATDYVNAQRLRRKMRREFDQLWNEVDCLVTPTTPNTAPRIGDTTVRLGGSEEDVRLATTRLVRGINALGYPGTFHALRPESCGTSRRAADHRPAFEEALLLARRRRAGRRRCGDSTVPDGVKSPSLVHQRYWPFWPVIPISEHGFLPGSVLRLLNVIGPNSKSFNDLPGDMSLSWAAIPPKQVVLRILVLSVTDRAKQVNLYKSAIINSD